MRLSWVAPDGIFRLYGPALIGNRRKLDFHTWKIWKAGAFLNAKNRTVLEKYWAQYPYRTENHFQAGLDWKRTAINPSYTILSTKNSRQFSWLLAWHAKKHKTWHKPPKTITLFVKILILKTVQRKGHSWHNIMKHPSPPDAEQQRQKTWAFCLFSSWLSWLPPQMQPRFMMRRSKVGKSWPRLQTRGLVVKS